MKDGNNVISLAVQVILQIAYEQVVMESMTSGESRIIIDKKMQTFDKKKKDQDSAFQFCM